LRMKQAAHVGSTHIHTYWYLWQTQLHIHHHRLKCTRAHAPHQRTNVIWLIDLVCIQTKGPGKKTKMAEFPIVSTTDGPQWSTAVAGAL
jgi:hypothetical protein